jgi:selenocysteine lyase/cysteine desulfurase
VGAENRALSFKALFSRSLEAAPGRLHFAAHSHHLWPDASYDGQMQAWEDAARLADRKWDKVMDDVWPEAQGHVARELGTGSADAVVFASNTHDFLVRLVAACPRRDPKQLRLLTSDGEFHSARRQFARWAEDGWLRIDTVAAEPFADFSQRFAAAAKAGGHDLIMVSQLLFNSGRIFELVDDLAAVSRPEGPWVVIDGYHAFMAIDRPLAGPATTAAFYLGGGYKYAMAGEGCAFMHAPPGFGPRPPVTGWFAEFEDLSLPPGSIGYARDARRFLGATFDPSSLYRFNAVQRMLSDGLTTSRINAHVTQLQQDLLSGIAETALGKAELLNPLGDTAHARFLAFRHPDAKRWYEELQAQQCITDVRGEVLRIGFGLYHDRNDVDALLRLLGRLT